MNEDEGNSGVDDAPSEMPGSVQLAVAMLMFFVIASMIVGMAAIRQEKVSFAQITIKLMLALAILYGVGARRRFAWLWGRTLALVTAVLMTTALIMNMIRLGGLGEGSLWLLGLVIAQIVSLFVVFVALDRPSAKAYLRLVCPSCGSSASRPADFFFQQAKCTGCGNVW